MKLRAHLLPRLWWLLLSVLCLLVSASVGFAQEEGGGAAGLAALGAIMTVFFLIAAAFYVYVALALMTIAKKTNTPNAWLAWIPIVNIILMLNVAKKPLWWFILCLIPLVNIVIFIIVWMAIAEARGKPNWWGILMIVPVVNLIVPGYLAWSD
jgi:magnesium-transporting ATPase (P-type)